MKGAAENWFRRGGFPERFLAGFLTVGGGLVAGEAVGWLSCFLDFFGDLSRRSISFLILCCSLWVKCLTF